jgi:hypothetical protein
MNIGILASWRVRGAQKQVAGRAKAHLDEIDLRIKEDSKCLRRMCDILLMGSSVFRSSFAFHPEFFKE